MQKKTGDFYGEAGIRYPTSLPSRILGIKENFDLERKWQAGIL